MKTFGIRLLLTAFLMMLLELIVINVAGILPFIAAHKAYISDAPYIQFLIENLLHPIKKTTHMIKEKNPLFYLGSGGVVLLSFYVTFFMKGAKGKYRLHIGNWMIGEGSKVSKEKIQEMLVPRNFAALHFQGAALPILLAVFALAFIAFLFSVAIFHADVMFLYLLSPLACVSVIADDNEYLGVRWREILSQIVTILAKIFLFVIALSILINENITFLNFLLFMGCCILLIKSPSVLRNMWYSSGSGRGMMGAMGGATKLAARRSF